MILHDIIVAIKGPLVLHYHRAFSLVNVVRSHQARQIQNSIFHNYRTFWSCCMIKELFGIV